MSDKTEVVHELRIQKIPFEDLISGAKTGEVRNSDRGFKVGDSVTLNEVAGEFPVPTGRQMRRRISHIQAGFGLPEGIVVLSYAPTEDARAVEDEPEIVAIVESALRRSFSLGQTYWMQADSDSTCQQNKSDQTMETQSNHIAMVVKSIQRLIK